MGFHDALKEYAAVSSKIMAARDRSYQGSALHEAIRAGDHNKLNDLLASEHVEHLESRDSNSCTPLMAALRYPAPQALNSKIIEALLSYGANADEESYELIINDEGKYEKHIRKEGWLEHLYCQEEINLSIFQLFIKHKGPASPYQLVDGPDGSRIPAIIKVYSNWLGAYTSITEVMNMPGSNYNEYEKNLVDLSNNEQTIHQFLMQHAPNPILTNHYEIIQFKQITSPKPLYYRIFERIKNELGNRIAENTRVILG